MGLLSQCQARGKVVKGGGGWMIPIGARTINRDRSIGLELLTCRLVGWGSLRLLILIRFVRHPLRHMGNPRVKY